MAIKTISLELDAYEKLKRAKRTPRESFSSVVRRGRFEGAPLTAGQMLEKYTRLAAEHPEKLIPEAILRRVEQRRRTARTRTKWDA